jgi:peroxidase
VAILAILSFVTAPVAASRSLSGSREGGCKEGFYQDSCPNVENIIYESMLQSFQNDPTVAPGVLRLAYHDCFVRGCDASLLLDGSSSERTNTINTGLHGFEAIDAAKAAVEKACPGTVSCSDVLQFAVRDTVKLTGGQGWTVPAGRRDGTVSRSSEVAANLMTPNNTVPVLLKAFQKKGLSAAQMVALAGAHTIGVAPCLTFDDRLHGEKVDPTLPSSFAKSLLKKCPMSGITNVNVNLDLVSPKKFDTQYFKNIVNKLGLLTSDQSMWVDSRTKGSVRANTDMSTFNSNFAKAMVAMSKIDVLTGSSGEIRRVCSSVN